MHGKPYFHHSCIIHISVKVKVRNIQIYHQGTSSLHEIICHIGSHSIYLLPSSGDFTAFTTAEGGTSFNNSDPGGMQGSVDVGGGYIHDSLPAKDGNIRAVSWPGFEPTTKSRKSDVLTSTPPSHIFK